MKILVVRLGALGDIVHAMPAVAALRRAMPSAQIDWLVDARHREVVDLVRGINGRISVDPAGNWRELPAVLRRLRGERYDAALDFQGLLKSAVLARFSGAARVIGFSRDVLRERAAAVFYRERRDIPRGHHVIEKNLQLAAALGVDVSQISFPFDVPPGPIIDGPYALLNPGAAWPNKRWPPAAFGEIAAWLQEVHRTPSIVLWGPQELDLASQVVAASAGAARLAPPTRIGDVLALARGARLMVSGDTGPLHLAAAVGAPIVGLYGPTSPGTERPVASRRRLALPQHGVRLPSSAPLQPRGSSLHRADQHRRRPRRHRATVRGVTTTVLQRLARLRVPLGFVFGACVVVLARPTWRTIAAGAAVGVLGESIRIWAAGHLEKSREVTRSGPYRYTRHPLYVGSSVMAAGVAIGAGSWAVAALVALYMGSTISAAVRTEEAFLRGRFGDEYAAYAERRAPEMARRFSLDRAWRNKEYRALVGLLVAIGLLALKAAFWPPR